MFQDYVLRNNQHCSSCQVAIYFNNKLLRGNRSIKQRSEDIDAFHSPNLQPLAVMGTHIAGTMSLCHSFCHKCLIKCQPLAINTLLAVRWRDVLDSTSLEKFHVHTEMASDVAMLRLFPGITTAIVRGPHHYLIIH